VIGIVHHLAKRLADRGHHLLVHAVVHEVGDPPGALLPDTLADEVLVRRDQPRDAAHHPIEELLVAVVDGEDLEPPGERGRDRAAAHRLDDRPLAISAEGIPDGPARLFLRPHDIDIVDEAACAIAGVVTATHRHGGLRRIDLAVRGGHRIEIALPATASRNVTGHVTVLPLRWRLYPDSGKANGGR